MKKFALLMGILLFAGAGCSYSPLSDTASDVADDATQAMQELENENQQLEREVDRLQEQLDDLKDEAKDTMGDLEDEAEEVLDDAEEAMEEATSGRESLNDYEREQPLADNEIDILLVAEERLSSGQPLFSFGCDNYLYASTIELADDKTQSDLATAIVQLLTLKSADIQTEGLSNAVGGKGLVLENIRYEEGKRIIEFSGDDISSPGVCEDARFKAQLEETIALYSSNAKIRLNESAKEWQCLFDGSPECVE